MAGIFLLAISPAPLFAQQTGTLARPQFRTAQPAQPAEPAPVLDQSAYRSSGPGFSGTEGLTNVPPGAFQTDRVGVTQSSLFRNTTFPYGPLVTLPAVGPSLRSENATADFKLDLPSLTGGVPWMQHGFEPQDADLKLGPFFVKLRALEAALLFSDNINLTPDHTEADTIAFVGATVDVIAQITESLRVTTSGTFIYLPFQGKGGIAGFGLTDIYNFGLAAGPLAHARIEWNTMIGGWNVVVADDFQILQAIYSNDYRSDQVLFEGGGFNDQAVAGRYVLRPNQGDVFRNAGNNNRNQFDFRTDQIVYSNLVSAGAERLLPGSVRMGVLLYHENLWYNQGSRGQPSLREGATVSLSDENPNTRFKPYFVYEAIRTDEFDSVQNIFRFGVRGPITDNLFLWAEGGYFTGGFSGNDGALWRVELDHTPSPYTRHSILYTREFNYFHDELDDIVGYNIHQILGPKLDTDFYAYRIHIDDQFDNSGFTDDQWRLGLRFTYAVGPKTTLRLTGEYYSSDFDNTEAWIGRAEIGYNFTNTLLLQLLYQYQKSNSDLFSRNYTENLIYVSLTKYFP